MARRPLTALCLAVLCAALAACGSDYTGGTAATTPPPRTSQARTDYGVMRDKVVLGLAKDFRAGTHAGPKGYALCVRLGVRRVLDEDQLNRLVAVYRRPDGEAFAAQALSRLAAPIGAECGGAKYVPEPIYASQALGGRYPLSRLAIAARRLGVSYGPYLGVTCRPPGTTRCESIGVDVVLGRDAQAVTAWVGEAAGSAHAGPSQRRRGAGLGRLSGSRRARTGR